MRFDQKGHERPFQKAVIIDIVDGYLVPGDRIVIRLGDRRQGGAGTRVQSFVERDFRFRMFIDPLGSSKFAEVPGDCALDIRPGPPHALSIIVPRLVDTTAHFDALIRLDDLWGNTCRDLVAAGSLLLRAPDETARTAPLAFAAEGWTVARLTGLGLASPGEWRLEARLDDGAVPPAVAHIQAEPLELPLRPVYADLHVHSNDPSAPTTRPTTWPMRATSPGWT